jgi:hypothetical protein
MLRVTWHKPIGGWHSLDDIDLAEVAEGVYYLARGQSRPCSPRRTRNCVRPNPSPPERQSRHSLQATGPAHYMGICTVGSAGRC